MKLYLEGIVLAIFEKIGDFAKSVGDKTGGMIETTKIKGKIKAENDAIMELHRQIGALCWNKFVEGNQFDEDVTSLLEQIKARFDTIAQLQEEIEAIARANQAAGNLTCPTCGTVNPPGTNFCSGCGTKMEVPPPVQNASGIKCQKCGAMNSEGTNFCVQCGSKVEAPPPEAADGIKCPSCSAVNTADTKFCVQCGSKIESPESNSSPKLCPSCGTELSADAVFCGSCGQKIT